MSAERTHADDTTVPVLAKMKAAVGRIGPMSGMTGRSAARIRRRHYFITRATGLESIRRVILPAMSV
jgi:hypothetical protein